MDRVNKILNNKKYNEYLNKIELCEKDRIFCRHNMDHFLDLARIAYIKVLEENLPFSKEIVYATALLHDVGRFLQYENGTPHEIASCNLSKEILDHSGFSGEEKNIILKAIKSHRLEDNFEDRFYEIIATSDKLSRKCFNCNAKSGCNWSDDKKNLRINY